MDVIHLALCISSGESIRHVLILSILLVSKKKTLTKVKAQNELMLSRFEQQLPDGRQTEQRVPTVEDVGDGVDDEDWHTFALSETPLTIPCTQHKHKTIPHEVPDYSVSKAMRTKIRKSTIPRSPCGIVIRERHDPIRATSPQPVLLLKLEKCQGRSGGVYYSEILALQTLMVELEIQTLVQMIQKNYQ
ncbi:hypothetical protein Bca4012_063375 [Brassica carinata]